MYPQIFPSHKRRSGGAREATLEWAQGRARRWLSVLDEHILGAENPCLCGGEITIVDYLAASFAALAKLTGSKLAEYPNVSRWPGRIKALQS